MPRNPNPERTAWQAAARERLRLVVDKKFEGNQSELAAALGVTRALVSIVLRSAQPPTKNLLARVGTIPGINPRWAATGEGEPFGPDTHGTLPVSVGILPGWPGRYPELLTGERCPTAEAFIQQSRYCLKVDLTCPALKAAELALLPGDLLMFDANSAMWVDRLDQSVGRLFGVRVKRGDQTSYLLALLKQDPIGLILDAFGDHYRLPTPSPSSPIEKPKAKGVHIKRMPRKVNSSVDLRELEGFVPETTGGPKPSQEVQAPPPSDIPYVSTADIVQSSVVTKKDIIAQPNVVTPEDIIAVRVGLFRQ